jgi:hypothetical protein
MPRPLHPLERAPRYLLDRTLGGTQSRFQSYAGEKYFLHQTVIALRFLDCIVCSLKEIWKETVVAQFEILSHHLQDRLSKSTKKFSQNSHFPGRKLTDTSPIQVRCIITRTTSLSHGYQSKLKRLKIIILMTKNYSIKVQRGCEARASGTRTVSASFKWVLICEFRRLHPWARTPQYISGCGTSGL